MTARQGFNVVTQILASAVATAGTFTVTYPAGSNAAWFQKGTEHRITALGALFVNPTDFTISTFGNTTCTITWKNAVTLPAGTTLRIKLDAPGPDSYRDDPPVFTDPSPNLITPLYPLRIVLGAPIAAAVAGYASAFPTIGGAATLNGTQVVGGIGLPDVPRNVTFTAVSTFTGATITGKDLYENTMVETVPANGGFGTITAGVKAFNQVTSIVWAATQTGAGTIGFGDVLGIPVFLPSAAFVNAELQDGVAASAGAFVAGASVNTVPTATTADVRGTYDPSAACDGVKAFELLVNLSDPTFKGTPQFAG